MRHETIEQQTFALERWRSIAAGITETANSTFLGVVAIQYFDAGQETKGLLMTNTSLGMLLSPVALWLVAGRGASAGRGAAFFSLLAAGACLLACIPYLSTFVIFSILAFLAAATVSPLYLAIYEGNYRTVTRGTLVARNYFPRIVANILFAPVAGALLKQDIRYYPAVLAAYAACFAFSAWCTHRMPDVMIASSTTRNPFRSLRHVRDDRRFRWTLVSWMLLGFANLTMFPLRTEYLANPDYKVGLDALYVALYTSTIPNIARLLFNRVWGPLFDRMDFVSLRIILNIGFMLGFLSFFTGVSHVGLVIGAVLFGISNAGADIVWNLWVTKIAPPTLSAEYMAVHTFFTGVRGAIAPLLAFHLTKTVSVSHIAFGCAALVIMASLLLWKERRSFRSQDEEVLPAETPVE